MVKLLRGNLNRLVKNKVFWLCIIAVIVCCVCIINQGILLSESGRKAVALEDYYFRVGPFLSLFLSVFIPLFVGVEYSFGTIRNKLTMGFTRGRIYLSYYISCLIGAGAILTAWFLAGLTGIPKLGLWQSGTTEIVFDFVVTILYAISLTAIFTFFSMMITGRSGSVVFQILLALGLILAASMIFNRLCEPEETRGMVLINGEIAMTEPEPNPMYIGGTMRRIFVALVNILPTGQAILMLHEESSGSVPINISLQIISSVLIALCVTAAGILTFRKKDLK